ncbi:hypothetical protein [Neisseria meningitidis]
MPFPENYPQSYPHYFFKTGFHPKYSGLTKIRTRRRSRRQYR